MKRPGLPLAGGLSHADGSQLRDIWDGCSRYYEQPSVGCGWDRTAETVTTNAPRCNADRERAGAALNASPWWPRSREGTSARRKPYVAHVALIAARRDLTLIPSPTSGQASQYRMRERAASYGEK